MYFDRKIYILRVPLYYHWRVTNQMMPNKTYELRNLYFQQSPGSAKQEEKKYDQPPLLQWPANGYFDKLKPDAQLLQKVLIPIVEYSTGKLSEQVFGDQLKQQHVNLEHMANLFYERCKLHKRHIDDINDRHIKVQGRLFGVEINNFPDRSKQLNTLEGQLMQLEQQRREEELAFWKDTVELREKLFENAGEYKAARHRYQIFSDVEAEYGG